jgi:uncharacterized protein (TIGR00661 family)
MGHATRSLVILGHLLEREHEIKVVVSGRAHAFLVDRLKSHTNVAIEEIHGLTLRYFGHRLDRAGSLFWNIRHAPKGIRRNVKVYRKVVEDGFQPELVVSDFESWAALYALSHKLPVVSIDNMQIINRCKHDKSITKAKGFDFGLARLAVKLKMPGAYHYLVSSFFFPPVRKRRTTLIPPILRPEVIAAKREPDRHVLMYLRAASSDETLSLLRELPYPFRVYGMTDRPSEGNVTIRPFSEAGFLEDLRTARAVIAGGGFSLMSEAVSLHVPMLSIPIEHQFEQELNARYLQRLGYGAWSRRLNPDLIDGFLKKSDDISHALGGYDRSDNSMTFDCLDELIELGGRGDKRPKRLGSPAKGKWNGG